MTALEQRLRDLGDHLDLGDDDGRLVDGVLARVGDSTPAPRTAASAWSHSWVRVAAAALIVVAVVAAAIPSSRRTVAGWFGLDGATVERDPRLEVPDTPDLLERRDVGTIVDVDDRPILVGAFTGTLENPGLAKVLGAGSNVSEVSVDGAYGLWIDGAPHEVVFFDAEGALVSEAFAGNTLLWQDGDVVFRLEGFDDVDEAIAYAELRATSP